MTITPVVPLPDSQLVVDTQAVIIDFDAAPVEVQVDSVVVWDNVSGFQNSWTGEYITATGIWRLVCDPPSPFTVGTNHEVYASTASESETYGFRVGLEKLTTESDLSAPQVVKVDTYTWSGRVHNNEDPSGLPSQFDGPGNVYLQVLDPRGSEVITVPGSEVGIVWDEGSNKVIIYFIRNSVVFYMEAAPGDTPTTQSQLRSLETTVRTSLTGGEGSEHYEDATYPPIKRIIDESPVIAMSGGEGYFVVNTSPYNAAPAPAIVSGELDGPPVVLRLERPTEDLESELIVGYYVVKFWKGTPSIIGYVTMDASDTYVEFRDSCLTVGARYGAMPVYRLNAYTQETRRERWGNKSLIEPGSISQVIEPQCTGGEGTWYFDEESFPPLKKAAVTDVELVQGGEGVFYWTDSSFSPTGT